MDGHKTVGQENSTIFTSIVQTNDTQVAFPFFEPNDVLNYSNTPRSPAAGGCSRLTKYRHAMSSGPISPIRENVESMEIKGGKTSRCVVHAFPADGVL